MGQKLTERQQVTTSDNNDIIHVVRNNQSYQMKADLIGSTIINESSSGNWVKGGVNWSGTGLTYNVWVNECAINSTVYNTLVSGQVTLSDGDATNPRIDKFIIEVNAFASPPTFEIKAVEGIPAVSPLEPSINLVNQAEIGFRITAANETVDPVTQLETIYDENTGESAEWYNDSVPSGANLDYATSPYQGSKCLYVPKVENEVAQWKTDSLITYNGEDSLVFALRADLSTAAEFQVKLINTSNDFYFLKTLKYSDLNKFGGKTSEVNWQLIQVKLSDFAPNSKSNTQYDSIEITFIKTPILSLDWIHIQSDLAQPSDPNRFTELSDTPNSYSGQGGKSVSVKSDETGIEFTDSGSLQQSTVRVSVSEIKNLGTTPKVLIPSQGTNTFIDLLGLTYQRNSGTTGFDNNLIKVRVQTSSDYISQLAGFLNSTSFLLYTNLGAQQTRKKNEPIILEGTDSVATGDITLDIHLTYVVYQTEPLIA